MCLGARGEPRVGIGTAVGEAPTGCRARLANARPTMCDDGLNSWHGGGNPSGRVWGGAPSCLGPLNSQYQCYTHKSACRIPTTPRGAPRCRCVESPSSTGSEEPIREALPSRTVKAGRVRKGPVPQPSPRGKARGSYLRMAVRRWSEPMLPWGRPLAVG